MQFSKTKFKGTLGTDFSISRLLLWSNSKCTVLFFFLQALDKHKFYVYEARLFYVTRGSMFLMFRSIYNPPRSLWTSPLHYFPRRVLSLKILRGRFVSYYGTKSSALRGPNTKEPVYCFNGISFCILYAAPAPSRSDKSRGI